MKTHEQIAKAIVAAGLGRSEPLETIDKPLEAIDNNQRKDAA